MTAQKKNDRAPTRKGVVRLQKRATRNISGRKFYNHYLTVPSNLVDTLGLEAGATFEPSVTKDGSIIYVPVHAAEGRLPTLAHRV